MILKIFALVALIKILLETHKPFLCSGIYTVITCISALFFTSRLVDVLIVCLITLALSSLYFWLLDRFEESGILWWIILICGIFII